jgi:hypothetical protein
MKFLRRAPLYKCLEKVKTLERDIIVKKIILDLVAKNFLLPGLLPAANDFEMGKIQDIFKGLTGLFQSSCIIAHKGCQMPIKLYAT